MACRHFKFKLGLIGALQLLPKGRFIPKLRREVLFSSYVSKMIDENESESRSSRPQSAKRVFPPLYRSTGDVSVDRLAFVHILERLKVSTHVITTEISSELVVD
jgi:hypothetical protein